MTYLVSGAGTYSKAADRWPKNAPQFAERAQGPYIFASDGKRYIDCTSSLGAILLGYGHPEVEAAVAAQAAIGNSFSLPTRLEHDLAERLCALIPCAEMVRFGKNGCDVTGAAVRIARAATGRQHIVYNGYHGHHDWSMTLPDKNGGVPECMGPFSHKMRDLEHLANLLDEFPVAGVIMEPVISATPVIPDPAYWRAVRSLCDHYGTLLILDEMVTFGRLGYPGAVTEWAIDADLWCGAKALGNGYPLTLVAGRRELMQRIEADVFYSTTFAGETTALAAGMKVLDILDRDGLPVQVGQVFRWGFDDAARHYGLDVRCGSYDMRPTFYNAPPELLEALVEEGVLCQGYLNVTWAHADVLDDLLAAFRSAMKRAADTMGRG